MSKKDTIDGIIEEETFEFPENIIDQAKKRIEETSSSKEQVAQTNTTDVLKSELHDVSEKLGTLMGDTTLPLEEETIEQLNEKVEEMANNKSSVSLEGIMKVFISFHIFIF